LPEAALEESGSALAPTLRDPDGRLRHGASVERKTSSPDEAYAHWEPSRRERPSIWNRLPWA
jgi:hypothetical protein